jgi:hypothetical protein
MSSISFKCLDFGEIRNGIQRLRRRDPTQTGISEVWLAALQRDFAERLLPVTNPVRASPRCSLECPAGAQLAGRPPASRGLQHWLHDGRERPAGWQQERGHRLR